MRYEVLHPKTWCDPRDLDLTSLEDLSRLAARRDDYATEQEAVSAVRKIYPDAIAMPCPLKVGEDGIVILGVLDKCRPVSSDPADAIDFALLVIPRPENDLDRKQIAKGKKSTFNQAKWKPPVIRPELAQKCSVELRGTDLALPVTVIAEVGHYQGRLAIRAELEGIAISLVFHDKTIQIVPASPSEAAATVASNGERSGSGDTPAA